MTIFLFRLMFVLLELFCVMYPLVRWLTLFVISRGIEMLAIIIIIYFRLFVTADEHFLVFNRFRNRSMTKKLCGFLAHW